MLIPVICSDGKRDRVEGFTLSHLIANRAIIKFKRRQGWVDIISDQLRESDERSVYFGRERRHETQQDSTQEAI